MTILDIDCIIPLNLGLKDLDMRSVLRYKWEVYCDTNWRSTESVSLFRRAQGHRKHSDTNSSCIAIQIGGVLRYFFEKWWWLGLLTFL